MLKSILKKFKSTKTIISVVSLVGLIFTTWGVQLPSDKIQATLQAVCSIGVILGVLYDEPKEEQGEDNEGV